MFRAVPLPIMRRSRAGWIPALLESCLQTCLTYTSAKCTVNELLMMGRGTVRNM